MYHQQQLGTFSLSCQQGAPGGVSMTDPALIKFNLLNQSFSLTLQTDPKPSYIHVLWFDLVNAGKRKDNPETSDVKVKAVNRKRSFGIFCY